MMGELLFPILDKAAAERDFPPAGIRFLKTFPPLRGAGNPGG